MFKQLLTIYIIIIGSKDVILNEEFTPQPVVWLVVHSQLTKFKTHVKC